MNFSFKSVETIPCLAWCCSLSERSNECEVVHGAAVYREADFFAEGAWNGEMSGESLRHSTVCAASGGLSDAETFVFVSPSNTMARLHAVRVGPQLFVSNSLAFLLARSKLKIDENYLFYEDDFSSIMHGLPEKRRSVPTADGPAIEVFWHCNLVVRPGLQIDIEQKSIPPAFESFSGYESFLRSALANLAANASHRSRAMAYTPIVSISKGYDSPTCAVLAKAIGCTTAVTVFDPAADDPYADCGTEIAKMLDMSVLSISRSEYKNELSEPEFLAVGTGGEDVFMAPLRSALQGRLFLTGFHGDKAWDRNSDKSSSRIVRGDPSGADLEEFRLRVNFIHVAVPFFGCVRQADIRAISKSSEMAPWTLGVDYDRPLCRRIVEGAGIPRGAFGQRKQVMSRAFRSGTRLDWYLGPRSLADFRAYAEARLRDDRHGGFKAVHAFARTVRRLVDVSSRLSFRASQILSKLTSRLGRYHEPLERRFLFHWAIEKQVAKYVYADALAVRGGEVGPMKSVVPCDQGIACNPNPS